MYVGDGVVSVAAAQWRPGRRSGRHSRFHRGRCGLRCMGDVAVGVVGILAVGELELLGGWTRAHRYGRGEEREQNDRHAKRKGSAGSGGDERETSSSWRGDGVKIRYPLRGRQRKARKMEFVQKCYKRFLNYQLRKLQYSAQMLPRLSSPAYSLLPLTAVRRRRRHRRRAACCI